MKKELEKIKHNYSESMKFYQGNYKSNHWNYINKKKRNLYKIQNLEKFRRNNLSYGLDDQFYTDREFKENFELLKKDCGDNFLRKTLFKKNIGKVKKFIKFENKYFVDRHEIFFIKFLYDLEKKINFKKIKYICDIGSGYGALASKILKLHNKKKLILIDLPESNLLSSFYLKKLFPEKKFFYSHQLSNNKFDKKILNNYDIFILNPWDEFPFKNIDLFINTRSMMEMDYQTIQKYFDLIHSKISHNGYFLNINRYYKDTSGYPIEFHRYPYDKKWQIIFSKTSWQQNHVHAMLTLRTKKESEAVYLEQKNIKKVMFKRIKQDPRIIRRVLPDTIYKIYKYLKKNI